MDALRRQISEWTAGKVLKGMRLYQVNPGHIIIEEERAWAVDGGVELILDEGVYCFGWSQDTDQFEFHKGALKELSPELDAVRLDEQQLRSLDHVLQRRIERVEVQSLAWRDLNEVDGESLLELRLAFQGGASIQIAAVDFDLDRPGANDLRFNVTEQILISVNKDYPIEHPPDLAEETE